MRRMTGLSRCMESAIGILFRSCAISLHTPIRDRDRFHLKNLDLSQRAISGCANCTS
jgi:hypothetical protein